MQELLKKFIFWNYFFQCSFSQWKIGVIKAQIFLPHFPRNNWKFILLLFSSFISLVSVFLLDLVSFLPSQWRKSPKLNYLLNKYQFQQINSRKLILSLGLLLSWESLPKTLQSLHRIETITEEFGISIGAQNPWILQLYQFIYMRMKNLHWKEKI